MKTDVVLHSFGGDRVYEDATVKKMLTNPPTIVLVYTAQNKKLVQVTSTLRFTILKETTVEEESKLDAPRPTRRKK